MAARRGAWLRLAMSFLVVAGGAAAQRKRHAVAALVVSGHKATSATFVDQSACATLTMAASARATGAFDGEFVLMTGPLGDDSPHDRSSWATAPKDWQVGHKRLVRDLAAAVPGIRVHDLVPLILSDRYAFMRRNLNYMKLAVYTLPYDAVMFIDLDVVVIEPLQPFFDKLTLEVELVGYRTCTAPVNSGFFVIRPDAGADGGRSRILSELSAITIRNKCPCHIRPPFSNQGFDRYGSISAELRRALWQTPRPSSKLLCAKVLDRKKGTWELAGAGTGQGLMWYYYGLKLKKYVSLSYDELPLVHYNQPGPKPWAAQAAPASRDVSVRQNCDFVWWQHHLRLSANESSRFSACGKLFGPSLAKKRAVGHFGAPSCCRSCPGGAHFSTAQNCSAAVGLNQYARNECRVVGELTARL
ncbi:hypothetical protein M885DRAFT_582194 [Pelagophyceae sp. CCMP2097]|nr:hypothetical protein M885DRAFT_582194 [Pelagophyceae sp. CCMP2097]